MISSTNYCNSAVRLICAALLLACGCSVAPVPAVSVDTAGSMDAASLRIAILPVVNFTTTSAPTAFIDQGWSNRLRQKGLRILDADVIDRVITDNRIRYLGGLDPVTAQIFRTQAGAEAVLITILELYSASSPPKIALSARLVSTARQPQILWINGIGMAGDDAPGLLNLDMITDPALLTGRALDYLSGALGRHVFSDKEKRATGPRARGVFRPEMVFRAFKVDAERTYRVAVVPFFNLSERQRAGDFMALIFAGALSAYQNFTVIEPGTVRRQLLDMRIIMPSGISLANADLVFDRLDADLIVNGEVLDYRDYERPAGSPEVDYSAQIIERKSREVVWTVKGHNTGDDGVVVFGMGKVHTAHELARQMVGLSVAEIFQ